MRVIFPDTTPIQAIKDAADSIGCELKRIDSDTLVVKPKKELGDNVRVLSRPEFGGDDRPGAA